jgi:hypothetical protein
MPAATQERRDRGHVRGTLDLHPYEIERAVPLALERHAGEPDEARGVRGTLEALDEGGLHEIEIRLFAVVLRGGRGVRPMRCLPLLRRAGIMPGTGSRMIIVHRRGSGPACGAPSGDQAAKRKGFWKEDLG